MGELPSSHLIARQIARLPRYLYASPHYLEFAGEPSQPTELTQHECLRLHTQKKDVWTLYRDAESVEVSIRGRFLLNNVGMIQRLAAQGLGIAVLTEDIAADEVANGHLHRILPQWQARPIPVYAVTETRLLPAKTQCFIDFLREHFNGTAVSTP